MTGQPGTRLRCPKCQKLLAVAYLPGNAWLESACPKCRHLVLFTPDAPPVVMARHGQPEARP